MAECCPLFVVGDPGILRKNLHKNTKWDRPPLFVLLKIEKSPGRMQFFCRKYMDVVV